MSKQTKKSEPVIYRDFVTDFAPRRFADIVGQPEVVYKMTRWILNSEIPKAILLWGDIGVGKTILAKLLSKSAACANRKATEYEACGECRPCKGYAIYSSYSEIGSRIIKPDKFREDVDDAIQGYRRSMFDEPAVGEWYPMLIDEFDEVNQQSKQDLLMQLDRPWKKSFIVATSANPDKIDPMLRDRFAKIEIQPPSKKELHDYILRICKTVGIDIVDPDSTSVVVDVTGGRFRKMLNLLQDIRSSSCPRLEEANIRKVSKGMLGIDDKKK